MRYKVDTRLEIVAIEGSLVLEIDEREIHDARLLAAIQDEDQDPVRLGRVLMSQGLVEKHIRASLIDEFHGPVSFLGDPQVTAKVDVSITGKVLKLFVTRFQVSLDVRPGHKIRVV